MKTRILDRECSTANSQRQSESGGESFSVNPALRLVADEWRIHPARFDEDLRGPGEVSRARQVAIAIVGEADGRTPWRMAADFGLDLSTVKNALARVRRRRAEDPEFSEQYRRLLGAYRSGRSRAAAKG